jgi:hypothetical protein
MQNYYVKNLEAIFTVRIKIKRKKLNVVYKFLSTYFQILRNNMRYCVLC